MGGRIQKRKNRKERRVDKRRYTNVIGVNKIEDGKQQVE